MFNVSTSDFSLPSTAPASAAADNQSALSRAQCFQVYVDIVFGSPKDECHGSGICSVVAMNEAMGASRSSDCRRAKGLLMANGGSNGGIEVVFRATDLCALLMKSVFRKQTFYMQEPCTLPQSIVHALNLPGNTLQPGVYPMRAYADGFVLCLALA